MGNGIIVTKNLSKIYGETKALQKANITIQRGDWTSIIGPSGSGKTTLLNMISCLDTATSGSVIVNGTNVSSLNQVKLTRFRRDNIGLIFQQYHLIPYLTALENVMMAQYYHSIVVEQDAREALENVGMGHRFDHIPSHLSGGEQQRVCIARALINDPKILLADEPTGNLDQKNGKIVLDLIKRLNDEGHTVVLVTHNPDISKKGNRIIELVDGKVTKVNVKNS
ncbi:MAG: ABC transporter ATP-binding protein [Candidatus Thermoplasmatota archaeon]|jgi:putative ABC transport system ATP-binding protein|nr:ABC transporter ATP-binding protein [Candidatus Thermoplasmatota archaeon]MDP7266264.1 ABC transporter ATP-binding protein [Candidatus Thermoplasmatota archaeon]